MGASALYYLLEVWGLPHPLCHGLGVVLACLRCCQDMEQPAGSWGLCLGALEHQESLRCHLGWERLFWAESGHKPRTGAAALSSAILLLPNKLKLYFFQSCSLGQAQVVYLIIYYFLFLLFI